MSTDEQDLAFIATHFENCTDHTLRKTLSFMDSMTKHRIYKFIREDYDELVSSEVQKSIQK
jgi:hypothetical protein|tara:strand:+ start:356 stop:538 length:183 start_codon:yes stop_codon:yes gene_type:complete